MIGGRTGEEEGGGGEGGENEIEDEEDKEEDKDKEVGIEREEEGGRGREEERGAVNWMRVTASWPEILTPWLMNMTRRLRKWRLRAKTTWSRASERPAVWMGPMKWRVQRQEET